MRMDHGILKGTADLPSIGRYDVPIEKIQRTQDSVILEITPNEWIKAKWTNDSTMSGVLEKDKTKQEVRLSRQ